MCVFACSAGVLLQPRNTPQFVTDQSRRQLEHGRGGVYTSACSCVLGGWATPAETPVETYVVSDRQLNRHVI